MTGPSSAEGAVRSRLRRVRDPGAHVRSRGDGVEVRPAVAGAVPVHVHHVVQVHRHERGVRPGGVPLAALLRPGRPGVGIHLVVGQGGV